MENSDPSWFGFALTLRSGQKFTRTELVKHLESQKIQSRLMFSGNFLRQSAFLEYKNQKGLYRVIGDLSCSDQVMENSFWLGVHPGLTEEMIERSLNTIKSFIK